MVLNSPMHCKALAQTRVVWKQSDTYICDGHCGMLFEQGFQLGQHVLVLLSAIGLQVWQER